MGARITLAGESLIAQKLGSQQSLEVVRFLFANVPGLDPNAPVDRAAAKPPAAQIVHSYTIPKQNSGFVNPNQVVYSAMLGSDIGDFDWNWIGLETAENVLFAVAYVPLQQKRKNIPPVQLGNNVTRNILVVFDGAQALTGITIDASTWQHDFTVRLKGIDERERLSNRDVFGRACFFGTALQVEKVGTVYQLKPGLAYVEGIRVELIDAVPITLPRLPTPVWLHVSLRRELNDVVASWRVGFDANPVDYVDAAGTQHYCVPLADLTTSTITDARVVEPIAGPLIQHLAARVGDYPQLRARATTKADVGLGNLPNAISDDDTIGSSVVLATTKAVNIARIFVQQAVDKLINGVTPAGRAKKLETARTLAISGAGVGSTTFDGSSDADILLTLADSGVRNGVYTKVAVTNKGIVIDGDTLAAQDIPGLDWTKIVSGKPTTLAGYGIANAIPTGATDKRPVLYSAEPGQNYWHGALELREAQLVGPTQKSFEYAPRMIFHWKDVIAGELALTANGALCWNAQALWHEGNFNPANKANKATTLEGYGITDAIKKGDYGLGSNVAPASPIDNRGLPGGFHYFGEGATTFGQAVGLINIPYGNSSFSGQLGFQQGGADVRILVRSVTNAGQWTKTRELWHTGNFNPDAKANVSNTLEGYGIVNAIPTGLTNKRPELYAPEAGSAYWHGALAIREAEAVGNTRLAPEYGPRVSFHWKDVVAGGLSMNAGGELLWNGNPLWHGANAPKNSANLAATGRWRCGTTGFMVQWGTVAAKPAVAHTVPFDVAFNGACFGVITSVNNDRATPDADSGYQVVSKTLTGFTAYRQDFNLTNIGADSGYTWFAVGL
jgi:hypothetical protein